MSERFHSISRISPAAEEAVETACDRQLDGLRYQLDHQQLGSFDECREVIREWILDECLIMDLDVEERLRLIEEFGSQFDLEIVDVTLNNLRLRIESLAAMIVHELGEIRALEALQEVEEFLDERDFSIEDLRGANPFATFPHHDEYDEDAWHVLTYHKPDGSERNVTVYEYTVGSFQCYVQEWFEREGLAEEEAEEGKS